MPSRRKIRRAWRRWPRRESRSNASYPSCRPASDSSDRRKSRPRSSNSRPAKRRASRGGSASRMPKPPSPPSQGTRASRIGNYSRRPRRVGRRRPSSSREEADDRSVRRRIAGAIAPRGLRICRAPHVCVVRRFANADWAIVPVAILFVLAGRALTVYPLCLPFTWSRWTVPMQDQHILWWGGLRGALTLALVPRLSSAAFGALAVPILQPRGRAMPMSPSTTAPKCRPKKNERA